MLWNLVHYIGSVSVFCGEVTSIMVHLMSLPFKQCQPFLFSEEMSLAEQAERVNFKFPFHRIKKCFSIDPFYLWHICNFQIL